ncbi:MAG: YcaO-like family protein [Acidobacteria bacterium]|nr:YcaO-like family protein [Acidobacteriota bacterium]
MAPHLNLFASLSEAEITLAKSRKLISPLTGVIHSVEEVTLDPEDEAEVNVFVSSLSEASRFSMPLSSRMNGGIGLSKSVAKARAIGEAVERYCSAFLDPDEVIYDSYEEVADRAVHPGQFALYSANQYASPGFPYPRFDETTRTGWVAGRNLTREEETLVPACLVYLPYRCIHPDEAILSPAISTGLACHGTFEQAAITALCEVIERDACMIMWLNRLSMPAALWEGEPAANRFRELFERSLGDIRLIDVTNDIGIPSFVSLSFGRINGERYVTAGAASSLDPLTGALKAVTESVNAATVLKIKLKKSKERGRGRQADFNEVQSFTDHGLLYCQPEMIEHLAFVYSSPASRELSEVPNLRTGRPGDDLRTCIRLLTARGLEAIVVDLTTEDIAEMGFHVVRVLAPGTIGLNADHQLRFLGGGRLYSAPVDMGYRSRKAAEDDLNPYPHPFQ